jgi:hemerythrin
VFLKVQKNSMALITKRKVQHGVYWVEIPEADLRILCSCPADCIKHLDVKGFLPMVKKNGTSIMSGPNAILLSDVLMQNGSVSNLSEFPLYHMFYFQGMVLADHPNYSAANPLLIGNEKQVSSQLKYFDLGHYGLLNEKEFLKLGETKAFTREYLRMKQKFAPDDQFIPAKKLIDSRIVEKKRLELRNGVFIKRLKLNVFEISYKGKKIQVDLNLRTGQNYQPTYKLPKAKVPEQYFAVAHCGEGDGWNSKQPCLTSLVVFDGQYYLLDAGPFVLNTLKAFGLKAIDIAGVFFTHIHDDHFAGLCSLTNDDRKLPVYATPIVRSSIQKKLGGLLSTTNREMAKRIKWVDMRQDEWNKFGKMEVKPIPTAHPVDTTVFIFRAKDKKRYSTYGHFTDITALKWLKKMIVPGKTKPGISKEYYQATKKMFSLKMDFKKIDVGGVPIHGDAEDFAKDKSGRIVLGHVHQPFSKRQLQIGDEVKFGEIDVLIDKKP